MISIDLGVIRSRSQGLIPSQLFPDSNWKGFNPGLMILYIYNVYGQQMISIDLGVVRSKVKVTRADSFSTVSGLKLKGFSSWIDDTSHV